MSQQDYQTKSQGRLKFRPGTQGCRVSQGHGYRRAYIFKAALPVAMRVCALRLLKVAGLGRGCFLLAKLTLSPKTVRCLVQLLCYMVHSVLAAVEQSVEPQMADKIRGRSRRTRVII